MIKVDWLAACGIQREDAWHCTGRFGDQFAYKNKDLVSHEISQTLLTNKKQGKVN
jgi:hypothetical protein